jgi:hypothetical protein
MTTNWEDVFFQDLLNDVNLNNPSTLAINSPKISLNLEQFEAVNIIANPTKGVPQTARNRKKVRQTVGNVPNEQVRNFVDLGPLFDISKKIVASFILIGPPGTGKTYVICIGSMLRVFNPENRITHLFIATFSNAGAYRIYQKFGDIAQALNAPNYFQRIKLVQSRDAQKTVAFSRLLSMISLSPDDFVIPNKRPYGTMEKDEWKDHLKEIYIFVGTSDSLGILATDSSSTVPIHAVIYDEASQLTVPQFFQVLPKKTPDSICVVGDDKQLPPVATLEALGVSALSYLQGRPEYQNIPVPLSQIKELTKQYRMHPSIAQLTQNILQSKRIVIPDGKTTLPGYTLPLPFQVPNTALFQSFDPTTQQTLKEILDPDHAVVVIDTSNLIDANDVTIGTSRENRTEAEIAIAINKSLLLCYKKLKQDDIILTSPYAAQVSIFNKQRINAGTVHQYQGQEAQAVIYSLTFATPGQKSDFFSKLNLMYVGLSRAEKKLIIIGNQAAMSSSNKGIQLVRQAIFRYKYQPNISPGYPSYPTDPSVQICVDQQFFTDIKQLI